jgi:FAD/FMN-containing dehydrogenase
MPPLSPTTHSALADLRAVLTGPVIAPGEPGYDQGRMPFYGKFNRRPAVIVRPAHAAEVAHVLRVAREAGLPLAVRGGGHSVAGHSSIEGGLLLDLSGLRALSLDLEHRTAWAEGGLTAAEYTAAAGAHGLATGFGDTGSVGLGGLTLGGGIGFLVRQHGLTIDDLLAAEVVTADGQLRRVDANTEPNLFWALRGGGGNFGVVTRFQYRLHPLPSVVGGMLVLPATRATIVGFMEACLDAPEALSGIANIMKAPPMPFVPASHVGQPIILASLCFAGDEDAAQPALAPFRALAAPLADLLKPMPYAGLYELFPPMQPGDVVEESARSTFMDRVDAASAEALLDALHSATVPDAVAQLRALGGAMARVPVEATAFAHRTRRFMAAVGTVYQRAEDRPEQDAWADRLIAALHNGPPGVYVNFLAHEAPARKHAAYPSPTWARLQAVKARYDPHNLFASNHNIPPA